MGAALLGALFAVTCAPSRAGADQTTIVPCGTTRALSIAGATTAYTVNAAIADASTGEGTVRIRGVAPGSTEIVVVAAGQVHVYPVRVTPGTSAAAPHAAAASAPVTERGSLQAGYDSGTGQATTALAFEERQGEAVRRFDLTTEIYVSPESSKTQAGLPLVSYEIAGPGHGVTLLDQSVTVSPLTFDDALVRGIHVEDGPWAFHLGESNAAQFGPYLIPSETQWLAGLTRSFGLSSSSALSANLYDVIDSKAETVAPGGTVGSLLYSYHPQPNLLAQAEVGFSHTFGFAATASYNDDRQYFDGSLVDKPQSFAALASDAQRGLLGNISYHRTIDDSLGLNADASESEYDIPTFRDNSALAQANASYRLSAHWSVGAGLAASSSDSVTPVAFKEQTLSVPLSLSYRDGTFSAGIQYTPTSNFAGAVTSGYGASIGEDIRGIRVNAFYDRSVDVATVSSLFSQFPALQSALEQAGISVNDPSELVAFLNDAALLASLGFSNLHVDVAPVRTDDGLNATWAVPGSHRDEMNFDYLDSDAQLVAGSMRFRIATLEYVRRFGDDNLDMSISSLHSAESELGVAVSSGASLTYGVSLLHRFGAVPEFLFPMRRGSIEGYVFRDEAQNGAWAASDEGLPGVDVTLDGRRTVQTDAVGHYVFNGVPYGSHELQPQLSPATFFFTTDSPATAQIGSTVNFGVASMDGRIFGTLSNDAGMGIGGVLLRIEGLDKEVTTGTDGTFELDGIPQGRYRVTADPASLPMGYDLSALSPVIANVTSGQPQEVSLSVRALRSISGSVQAFDRKRAAFVPVPNERISIPSLHISTATNGAGEYAFRSLPAGSYFVEVVGISVERRTVHLPSDPTTLRDVDFRLTATEAVGRISKGRRRDQRP